MHDLRNLIIISNCYIKIHQKAHLDIWVFENGDRDEADPELGRRIYPYETETTRLDKGFGKSLLF